MECAFKFVNATYMLHIGATLRAETIFVGFRVENELHTALHAVHMITIEMDVELILACIQALAILAQSTKQSSARFLLLVLLQLRNKQVLLVVVRLVHSLCLFRLLNRVEHALIHLKSLEL